MNWPDIFFKARPPRAQAKTPAKPPGLLSGGDENPKAAAEGGSSKVPAEGATATGRLPVSQVMLPPAPVHSGSSDSSVMREMAEADTMREMTRSGGIRLVKRDFSFPSATLKTRSTVPPFVPKTGAIPPMVRDSVPKIEAPAPVPVETPSPTPMVPTAGSGQRSFPAINLSGMRDSAATAAAAATPRPAMTIFRRRTKIADVARIVLPPRRDDVTSPRTSISTPTEPVVPQPEVASSETPVSAPTPPVAPLPEPSPAPAPEESVSTSAVIPSSFPVEIPTGSVLQSEVAAGEVKPVEAVTEVPSTIEAPAESEGTVESVPEAENKIETPAEPEAAALVAEQPSHEAAPVQETPATDSSLPVMPPADTREKKEFVLSNGERIFGHVLSETPEAIYIDHGTLGVLTIARNQIALRPVEIILINGDRIVGDIIAETADSLFVRHASLGILTVPRNQRSNRVVEAILKDGDRILGEVLGETENFTVIRSATLGTVAVPHNRVAMLNRRAEQVQMRSLPPGTAELENKAAS
jgi:RNase P/RNase MRP subunit p29